MADYLIKDTTLTNIADAIRAKKSSTDTYTPAEMATAISSIETGGGGGELTEEDLTFTGDLEKFNYNGRMSKIIKKYGSKMRFNSVNNLKAAFFGKDPLNSDFSNWTISLSRCNLTNCFMSSSITGFPKFQGTVISLKTLFWLGESMESIPDDLFSAVTEFSYKEAESDYSGIFSGCKALKKVPLWFGNMAFTVKAGQISSYSSVYYNTFFNCYKLKELILPIIPSPANLRSNSFDKTFNNVRSMRKFIFAPPPAGNEAVLWTHQTINLADTNCGYSISAVQMTGHIISDDETYNLYKNDPDAWADKLEYSFYNHDSALETIRSLPYTEYFDTPHDQLQNVIRFYGKSGEKTDGGAINTLTTTEIAIATNKGWTVSFV